MSQSIDLGIQKVIVQTQSILRDAKKEQAAPKSYFSFEKTKNKVNEI